MRGMLLVVAVVALAGAGWLLLASRDAGTPAPLAPAAPAAQPLDAATAGAAHSAPAAAENVARAAPTAGELDRDAPRAMPGDAPLLAVRIVDAATGDPIAGADVRWSNESTWAPVNQLSAAARHAARQDPDAWVLAHGFRARSDRDGLVHVHLHAAGTRVRAFAGGRYGAESFRRDEPTPPEGHRVLVEPDVTLRVRVVDHAGRAASGVPVALERRTPSRQNRVARGALLTDEHGVAAFLHVQQRRSPGPEERELAEPWDVVVAIQQLDVPPVPVELQPPPAEPVTIKLPPTGRLKARVTFAGRPLPGLDELALHAGPARDAIAANCAWTAFVGEDGWARWGFVPLAKTLFVVPRQSASTWECATPGPTAPDQELAFTIDLADSVIALQGRMLGDDGTPLANEAFRASFDAAIVRGGAEVRTDVEGRFFWPLRQRRDEAREPRLERLTFDHARPGEPPQRATVAPRGLAVGANELGDVHFGTLALLAGGRLEPDAPGPVRAMLTVETLAVETAPRRDAGDVASGTVVWRQLDAWRDAPLVIDARDDGVFTVHGPVGPGEYRLRVTSPDHLPVEPVPFTPGDGDVRIALRRACTLTVTCRLPAGIPSEWIRLDLVPRDAPPPSPPPFSPDDPLDFGRKPSPLRAQPQVARDEFVSYRWGPLEAGDYRLRVEAAGIGTVATVPDIRLPLPPGGDARLAPLDLRGAVATLAVRLTLPPAEGATDDVCAFVQPQANELRWEGVTLRGGRRVLLVPPGPVDVFFGAEGRRPMLVRGATDEVDVVLEPWPTVEVQLLCPVPLPDGVTLSCGAGEVGAADARQRWYQTDGSGGNLEKLTRASRYGGSELRDGRAVLVLGDGPQRLFVGLAHGSGPTVPLRQGVPERVVAGPAVVVTLAPDEVTAAIATLRAREQQRQQQQQQQQHQQQQRQQTGK
jgi:hypothetical protein